MSNVNNFDVLKAMCARNLDIHIAPLSNITNLKKVKAGTQVTIGVGGDWVAKLGLEQAYVGGLLLANKEQFDELKRSEETQADARIRAAAHDLLDACKTALDSAHPHPTEHPTMTAAWAVLRAAIAKAQPQPDPAPCPTGGAE